MEDVLEQAARWRGAGLGVALATVVETWGSSPRPAGSQLAVNQDGAFVGSVSGGCVEGAVVDAAGQVIASGEPQQLEFGVTDEQAWEVGLACGGRVRVYVERVQPASELLGQLLADRAARRPAVLATWLDSGRQQLLHGDGTPDASLEVSLLDAAREALTSDGPLTRPTEDGPVFLLPFNPPLRLFVVGAVHIAQQLAPLAARTGYEVTVIDPRGAFATEARFPEMALSRDWPDDALRAEALDRRCAVVTLTHDPKIDDPALAVALASDVFYIGSLGSRRTQARRLERLREGGFDEATLARIHGPIGLPIGARSPAEIAVAILAEMTARLRGAEM